jgi:hypothetical protein
MKIKFLLVLERPESVLKRCRLKSFSAGPPAPLDLAFQKISITGKKMHTGVGEIIDKEGFVRLYIR